MTIEPRMTAENKESEEGIKTLDYMNEMASTGLRTLMFCMKELDSSFDHDKV